MKRVYGIETEYWLLSQNLEPVPTDDLRAHFSKLARRQFLPNGARYYWDNTHLEYATPEAASLLETVAHYNAGDLIVAGEPFRAIKNNTNGLESWGHHENYYVKLPDDEAKLRRFLLPYVTTRHIFTGAGFVKDGVFYISQRPDVTTGFLMDGILYLSHDLGGICIKKEDKIDQDCPSGYGRLHIRTDDSTMSEIATFLSLGSMSLVLDLFEDRETADIPFVFPSGTSAEINSDLTLKKSFLLQNNSTITATGIQRVYFEKAKRYQGRDWETDMVLDIWDEVLAGLEGDRSHLARKLDWVAKERIIHDLVQEGISPIDPIFETVDRQYHLLGEDGLYYRLKKEGLVDTIVDPEAVKRAVTEPPQNTRAVIRGALAQSQNYKRVNFLDWSRAIVKKGLLSEAVIEFLDPFSTDMSQISKLGIFPKKNPSPKEQKYSGFARKILRKLSGKPD